MKDEEEIRYEMLKTGDLVEYVDPIPYGPPIEMPPGLVIETPGINYVRVMWLDKELKSGKFLRRELKLLSRACEVKKTPKKNCKR